jgi:hypothetical protein
MRTGLLGCGVQFRTRTTPYLFARVLQADGKDPGRGRLFSMRGGLPRSSFARLNSDGSLDRDIQSRGRRAVYVRSIAFFASGRQDAGGVVGFTTLAGTTSAGVLARLNNIRAGQPMSELRRFERDLVRGGGQPRKCGTLTFGLTSTKRPVPLDQPGRGAHASWGWQRERMVSLTAGGRIRTQGPGSSRREWQRLGLVRANDLAARASAGAPSGRKVRRRLTCSWASPDVRYAVDTTTDLQRDGVMVYRPKRFTLTNPVH